MLLSSRICIQRSPKLCIFASMSLAANLALGQIAPTAEQLQALRAEIQELRTVQQLLRSRLAQDEQALGAIGGRVDRNEQSVSQLRAKAAEVAASAAAISIQLSNESSQIQQAAERLSGVDRRLAGEGAKIGDLKVVADGNTRHIDRFWLMIAAALVFFMQAGFKCLEVGLVRDVHGASTAMKNLLDWVALSAVYFLIGYGLMFGSTYHGWIGTDLFVPTDTEMAVANPKFGLEHFVFQLAFAGTAATIVSGAMAERTGLIPYLVTAIFVGLLIYPVVGHWVWGATFTRADGVPIPTGWLKRDGFIDFAGSTVVHSVGAWVSLAGIIVIGARQGRFKNGVVNHDDFKPYSVAYSALGVFILWLGWWGFNGGSQLRYDLAVSKIILNTNISGAFGGLTAFIFSLPYDRRNSYQKFLGGILGGLVAITASCDIVSSQQALVIGSLAGIVHNIAFDLLLAIKLDDPVGAIPVHGMCGVFGTFCVGIFGKLPNDIGRIDQIITQAKGVAAVFGYVFTASVVFFLLLDVSLGLRVSGEDEKNGFWIGKTGRRFLREAEQPALE